MGELSKYIGEIGEDIAKNFFEKVGWKSVIQNETIQCIHPQKHKDGTRKRTTHGVDILFSYISQTEPATLQHVYVSCKNTSNPYPQNPTNTFKTYLKDLIIGLECFKHSKLKYGIAESFNGFSNQIDTGVLFWISCDKETNDNVIDKIKFCRIDNSFDFGNIYVIDNEIALFHTKIIDYIEKTFKEHEWSYYLPETGIVYADKSITRNTKILPVEFINSRFITFRLDNTNSTNNKPILLIATKDDFTKDNLGMYIQVAREYTSEITTEYYFLFPNYNKIENSSEVNNVKMALPEKLQISFEVASFNSERIRGLYNGQ